MSRHVERVVLWVAVAAAATLVVFPAQGQVQGQAQGSQLPLVDISAPRAAQVAGLPPRVDVSSACPSYGQALTASLQGQLPSVEAPTEHVVRFRVSGDGSIVGIGFWQTPMHLRPTLRRAVRDINCQHDGQDHQRFAFIVRVMPEGQGDSEVVALKVGSPVLTLLAAQ